MESDRLEFKPTVTNFGNFSRMFYTVFESHCLIL